MRLLLIKLQFKHQQKLHAEKDFINVKTIVAMSIETADVTVDVASKIK